jgi:hypothetical protein
MAPVFTARRSYEFSASMAFAVQMILLTACGKAKNAITRSQFRRQAPVMAGIFLPIAGFEGVKGLQTGIGILCPVNLAQGWHERLPVLP